MNNVTSIDDKREQRANDAKERLLNTPAKLNKITRLLNEDADYQKLDLTRHIEDGHILKRLALSIEKAKHVAYPSSSAFLMLIASYSGYATKCYKVARRKGDIKGIPIGIYVLGEQDSGCGKDFALNKVNDVFKTAHNAFKNDAWQKVKELKSTIDSLKNGGDDTESKAEIASLNKDLKQAESLVDAIKGYKLTLGDTTPEALEMSLIKTNGFFNLISSEASLLNVLVGGHYSNGASNNEVLLKSFDGESVSSLRIGRESFDGRAGGSLTLFIQKGGIKKLFESSGHSGLHERVLKIVEPNRAGYRDFVNGCEFNWFLDDELEAKLDPLIKMILTPENVKEPKSLYDLPILTITDSSILEIDHLRNRMERTVRKGEFYGDCKTEMLGTLSKCDMQVLKIASCLHLLDDGYYTMEIADKHVLSAIGIVEELLLSYRDLMANESLSGEKAQYEKIIGYLSKTNQPRTITDIRANLKGVKPFTMPNSSTVIKRAIDEMIEHDVLVIDGNNRVIIA